MLLPLAGSFTGCLSSLDLFVELPKVNALLTGLGLVTSLFSKTESDTFPLDCSVIRVTLGVELRPTVGTSKGFTMLMSSLGTAESFKGNGISGRTTAGVELSFSISFALLLVLVNLFLILFTCFVDEVAPFS